MRTQPGSTEGIARLAGFRQRPANQTSGQRLANQATAGCPLMT